MISALSPPMMQRDNDRAASTVQRPEADRNYQKLFSRIQRIVPVIETETEIAGVRYPWTQVVDPDKLLEDALSRTDRSSAELDPFWAANWRAATGLDRFLSGLNLSKVRLLEVGCGSGRAGIAAALRGAQVTLTDVVGPALLVTRLNAWPVRARAEVRRLDWKDETLEGERFPIIIGSDIVYDISLWPILEPCLRRHLAPGGIVLLSEPQRHTGDKFIPWIQNSGWELESQLLSLGDGKRDIRIFQCRPKV